MKIFNLIFKIVYWVLFTLISLFLIFVSVRYILDTINYPDAMEGGLAIFAGYLIALIGCLIIFIITLISFIINKIFKYNYKKYIKYIILSILNPLIYLALLFTILGIGSLFY